MSGGYSGRDAGDAGRGQRGGRGRRVSGQPGYGSEGYDDQDYGEPGYGDRDRPRRGGGAQPPETDPGGWPGQPQGAGPGRGQPYDPPYEPQGRDWEYGQDQPYEGYGQPPGPDQGYYPPEGPGQGYGQPQGRDQWYGPQDPSLDPRERGPRQPAWPGDPGQDAYGTGPRGAQRGVDPGWQPPGGYDQRGAAPRRAADSYPGDGYPGDGYRGRDDVQFRQGDYQGWGGDQRRDSGFMPGFGQGGDHEGGSGAPGGPGGRYPGEAGGYAGDYEYEDEDERPARQALRGRGGRDGGGGDWGDGGRRRQRSTLRRLAPWIALLVILTPILIGGLYVYHLYEDKYHPADYSGPGTGSVTVQVDSGDTAFSLGPRLQTLGVVASARAFELAAEHSSNTTGLEAGFYKLHMHMQATLAWAALLNPKNRVQLTVAIPEGKRASQVIAILAKETSIPLADFQAVLKNPSQLGLPSYAKGDPEGFLFPATYTIAPNETALQILKAMVARYGVEAQQINISAAAKRVGLTPEELITEASMVQAEGGVVSDYAKIARVIINRLADGMKLQFDSVLLYGLNAYAVNVTDAQINTPGPYNDFQHAGLPPGPICNPGDSAIQAILHPASGDWLYFLTKTGGASEFSATPLPGQ